MILHVDGDAFFASCEIAQNERFRGKPVVAGADRGIALAVSYEAKKLGISRGMTIKEIRRHFPHVIVTHSHYDVYRIYSLRMFEIVRRYTPLVEEYSIDECFADLTHTDHPEKIARMIQYDLEKDLGITFSIGVAPTKVLAKVASKWNKPAGFTMIIPEKIYLFLEKIQVGKIWGIGPSSSANLMKHNIKTALELALKQESWIREHLSKPYIEIWHELQGKSVLKVYPGAHHKYKSVMKTGTFHPITNDKKILLRELSHNTERACEKLRKNNLVAQEVSFYVKSQEFRHYYTEIKLPIATAMPHNILNHIQENFEKIFDKRQLYRATGVILRSIKPSDTFQQDIFGSTDTHHSQSEIYKIIDQVNSNQKHHSVFLTRSLHRSSKTSSQVIPHLNIPFWGEAT